MNQTDIGALARAWLDEDQDPETRSELDALLKSGDEEALADCFRGRLEFGTAGLRGVLGPGPNRMNRVMVRRATAGLAAYLKENVANAETRGVVVGCDARKNSSIFALDAAAVLLGAGLKVHLLPPRVPTPLVSFATLDLFAAGGIMVTASHNPPEYNGYKVYWETAGQIVPPQDSGISAAIDRVGRTDLLPMPDLDEARASGMLVDLGDEIVTRYFAGIAGLGVHPEAPAASGLVVAYTPLHGVGAEMTEQAFSRAGFEHLHVVPEQREPDPSFPTVRFPNPEEPGAMDALLAVATRVGADVALAADPDADRLGVALPNPGNGWRALSGDEIGVLLAHYLLSEGEGGSDRCVATTVVSSRMLSAMAAHHGVHYVDTLTGLKWIVDATLKHKAQHGSRLVLGYENALGYMVGELVRDKDGISAALLFAEMAAWLKINGRTVLDYLEEAYRLYGLFLTKTTNLVFPPREMSRIAELMAAVRRYPIEAIGDCRVLRTVDSIHGTDDLPPADQLLQELEGGARVLLRPSGTEPKLKSYYEVRETVHPGESVSAARARASAALDDLETAHQALLAGLSQESAAG